MCQLEKDTVLVCYDRESLVLLACFWGVCLYANRKVDKVTIDSVVVSRTDVDQNMCIEGCVNGLTCRQSDKEGQTEIYR